jgi:hypothetical protein
LGASASSFDERCLPHTPKGCFEIGEAEMRAGRRAQAMAYYLRACLNGLGVACNRLGFYTEEGGEARRAFHFYLLACDRDSDRGCSNLSRLANRFGKYELSEAARKKACGLGNVHACKKVDGNPAEFYCSPALKRPCHEFDQRYSERWKTVKSVIQQERAREQKLILETIDQQPAAKILEIDPVKLEEIPPAKIAEKLDEKTVATLSEEQIHKVPPAVVEEKAWDVSFFDSLKPGMNKLLSCHALQAQTLDLKYERVLSRGSS